MYKLEEKCTFIVINANKQNICLNSNLTLASKILNPFFPTCVNNSDIKCPIYCIYNMYTLV